MANVVVINIALPADLRNRVRSIAKKKRTTTAQIVRDALAEKVEYLEAKERAEDDRRRKERTERAQGPRGIGRSALAPLPPRVEAREAAPTADIHPDEQALYETHAARVFEAFDQPLEKRMRVREAIAAVKRQSPLTHPGDDAILARLTAAVAELQSMQSYVQEQRAIDTSKIRTFGEVADDENETTTEENDP